jgi:putative sterol carrier protein
VSSDATAEFFDGLAGRGYEPLLAKVGGSARFDVIDGERTDCWLVTIDKGSIGVSRASAAADCVLRTDKGASDRIVGGELNFMAAVLRGEVTVQGDPRMLVRLQRLFPRPQDALARQRAARAAKAEP